jgi:hypothetical protein
VLLLIGYEAKVHISPVGKNPRENFFPKIYFRRGFFFYEGISYFCVGALAYRGKGPKEVPWWGLLVLKG